MAPDNAPVASSSFQIPVSWVPSSPVVKSIAVLLSQTFSTCPTPPEFGA